MYHNICAGILRLQGGTFLAQNKSKIRGGIVSQNDTLKIYYIFTAEIIAEFMLIVGDNRQPESVISMRIIECVVMVLHKTLKMAA